MSDLGIPIPKVKPNGVFCAGCGETGKHADTCPSRTSPMDPATAGDVSLLRGMISAWIERGQTVNKRLDALETSLRETDDHIQELAERIVALEDRLHRVVGYSGQQDRNTAECLVALENRLSVMEAKRKK